MKLAIFIHRPILASVISIIIALCGLVAALNLPLEQYPNISPPSIVVSAQYPGASAETIEKSIAAQFENKLNGISNVLYMASNSTGSGSVSIRLTFEVGTNLNYAVNEVLNRVHAAMPLLPSVVQQLGVTVRRSSPDMLMTLDFYNQGGNFNEYYLSNYIQRTVNNDLSLVPGVGQVNSFGHTYAIRVWLNVNKMNSLNVSPTDIANAIKDQSNEYVIGRSNASPIESAVLTFNIMGSEMYSTPQQFANIVIRNKGNQFLRIKDVARVELGGSNYNYIVQSAFKDEHNAKKQQEVVVMMIFMDPMANQLEVKKRVLKRLAQDAKNFPPGLKYQVSFDATQFVSASIDNVERALRDAFLLVGLVIFVFLQNWRASVIALVTIPVAVLGSFACLYLLGYSINTLTLFALILAIGIVVDDAIVVIENIERLKTTHVGLSIKRAVELAMHEVFGAVIAICLVLSVVFLPVMGLGGLSGVLYRQFAVTIACTVIISALAALTLTPALSGLLLKKHRPLTYLGQKFNQIFEHIANFYLYLAEKIIDWGKYSILAFILVIASVAFIYKLIPLSFVPNEDQGYFIAAVDLPSSASLEQTQALTAKIAAQIMQKPAVEEVLQIVGYDMLSGGGTNAYAATLIIRLKNWSERKKKADMVDALVLYVNMLNLRYKEAKIIAFNQPPIRGLSTTGGIEFYLEDRAVGDIMQLGKVATLLDKRLMQHKEIKRAYHILDTDVEQVLITPDVDKAKFYKVNVVNIYNTIQSVYSNYNVNFAFLMQGLIWVILQADYPFRVGIANMKNIYIKSNTQTLIPLDSLVKVGYFKSPQIVERFNDYLATKEIVEPNPGYSSGDIMNIIVNEMSQLPKGYNYDWFGSSFQQQQSQKTSTLAFIFSFFMIYLVLCALYEMWRLPLVVLMGVPFALFGSGIMLLLRSQPNDLYFQISLITLLGLSAKNIILLIEFALKRFNAGHTAKDSALYALRLRFRPIVMTSITFIMGALPLVFASGAGANAEHSVGTGIIGGMLGSVVLGTLFTPSYFVLIMKNYNRKKED